MKGEPSPKLLKIANKLVGTVGIPTKTALSFTEEPYVEFATHIVTEKDIIPIWEQWIKAYMLFASYVYNGDLTNQLYPPTIYWRIEPEIKKTGNFYQVYARLLISNKDMFWKTRGIKKETI
jgi:hypothetical protein